MTSNTTPSLSPYFVDLSLSGLRCFSELLKQEEHEAAESEPEGKS
jgi:hypothetical protein